MTNGNQANTQHARCACLWLGLGTIQKGLLEAKDAIDLDAGNFRKIYPFSNSKRSVEAWLIFLEQLMEELSQELCGSILTNLSVEVWGEQST